MRNIGNALIILGGAYIGFTHGFVWWTILIMVLGVLSWCMNITSSEENELMKDKSRYYRAKADYYFAKEKEIELNNEKIRQR